MHGENKAPKDQTQGAGKSSSAELQKKLQKIGSPEKLEESHSDEGLLRHVEQADFENPLERFQQSQAIVRSKDTESVGERGLKPRYQEGQTQHRGSESVEWTKNARRGRT